MSCANRRNEIDRITPDVECVYERNDPFENSGGVVSLLVAHDAECDGQTQFDEDEGELDPEGEGEDAVLAVMDSESLVFPTNKDRADDVSSTVLISSMSWNRVETWKEGTYMKITKQVSWIVEYLMLFRQVKMIKPIIPITAKIVASTLSSFWNQEVFRAIVPRCRSHLSVTNTLVKVTTVTVPIAMKRG